MELVLASYWFYILIGALVGFIAVTSGAFKEGAGIVLLFLCVGAIVVAAVAGALSSVLPAAIAAIAGRAALACVFFVAATLITEKVTRR